MGKYGRPKKTDEERRGALKLLVSYNEREKQTVGEKAQAAGVTPTEWARLASLEQEPPMRRVIPEINREAWLELARLAATLNGAMWRFRPGDEQGLWEAFEAVRRELGSVRNELIGVSAVSQGGRK